MNSEKIFKDHYTKYYGVVNNTVLKYGLSEDITQDIWVKIFELIKQKKIDVHEGFFPNSLYRRIASNYCIDLKRSPRYKFNQKINEIQYNDDVAFSESTYEEDILMVINIAHNTIKNPKQLAVFNDRYLHGIPFREISENRNLTEGECRLMIFRVIQKLRKMHKEKPLISQGL